MCESEACTDLNIGNTSHSMCSLVFEDDYPKKEITADCVIDLKSPRKGLELGTFQVISQWSMMKITILY